MKMFNYDKNKGCKPELYDCVKICHTYSDMDGVLGYIGGWADGHGYIAIVILDERYYGQKAVTMPVVCLERVGEISPEEI